MPNRRKSKGFTIIELLLAITLFMVASTSLYLSMRSGLLLYKRSEEGLRVNHEILHFLTRFSREVRNSFYYSPVPFEGSERSILFPTTLRKYEKDAVNADVFTVQYEFKSKALIRREQSLSRDEKKEQKRKILDDSLDAFSFSYGFFDKERKELEWKTKWDAEDAEAVPQAIRIQATVRYFDRDNNKLGTKKIEKKIWIPHGEWGDEE